MGVAMMEDIVSTVGAILKTLECPICFDLLKVPVSAGCGHFFCQHCASGILQSNYRAPCPLCKRSFTRRSVQTASQRLSVISAARALAETCSSLTGTKFNGIDSFIKEGRKSTDVNTPIPTKKFRSSTEKGENTRKRKSVENEDSEVGVAECVSKGDKEEKVEASPEDKLSKKRICPNLQDYDSDDDLPSLDDLLNQSRRMSKSSTASNVAENPVEKPLSIFPTEKKSSLKTYASFRKKKETSEPIKVCMDVDSDANENEVEYSSCNDNNTAYDKTVKEKSVSNAKSTVLTKNKINALKNKTNEVQPKHTQSCILPLKPTDVIKPSEKSEAIVKSKENKTISDASVPSKIIPRNQPGSKIQKRGRRKNSLRSCNSSASKNKDTEGENIIVSSENKGSYTLSEVSLSTSLHEDQNEQVEEKKAEDPFKSMGLTDTAISVNPVLSPLAAKTLSMLKSPGWSRVKEVKREFKVKKFKSLHVEKNSPVSSLKNTLAADCAEERSEQPMDVSENKIDSDQENLPNFSNLSHSDLGKEKEQQPKDVKESSYESRPVELEQVCQAENEVVHQGNVDKLESHAVLEDYSLPNKLNANYLKEDISAKAPHVATTECSITSAKLPTVSITSNSVICANYTNVKDKISKQNVVKTKIVCEIPNNSTLADDLNGQNNSLISKYIQNNCPEANAILNNPADIKQGTFPLSSQISGYQTIHAHSILNEDDGFQYVEQSQQTSQMFNFDLPKPEYNRWNSLAQPCILPKQTNRERTKVMKRTCLTLEEIQDGFFKSQESNQAETLCSVPFMDGQFKLHINVSDDTLNVSVLKVISDDINVSVPLNKYIQTSNNLFLPSILPSSNAGSESSQPDPASNPFPNLNKASAAHDSDPEEDVIHQNESPCVDRNPDVAPCEIDIQLEEPQHLNNDCDQQCDYENLENENEMEMSEIIHFPPETSDEKYTFESKSDKSGNEEKNYQKVEQSSKKDATRTIPLEPNCNSLENDQCFGQKNDVEANNAINLESDGFSYSDKEEKLEKSLKNNQEIDFQNRNSNTLPSGGSQKVQIDLDAFSDSDHEEKIKKSTETNPKCYKSDSPNKDSSNLSFKEREVMQLDSDGFSDSDQEGKLGKSLATNQISLKSELQKKPFSSLPCEKSKVEQLVSDEFSDSDQDDPLKILEKCLHPGSKDKRKKISKLSLKKKATGRKSRILDSSDESDEENEKPVKENDSKVSLLPEKASKTLSPIKSLDTLVESEKITDIKNSANQSVAGDTLSAFTSEYSEDIQETNASGIILEIKDLAEKIKSLEGKLKQCGYSDLQSVSQLDLSKHEKSNELNDSEDSSSDLFPQSVPPTPPNRV